MDELWSGVKLVSMVIGLMAPVVLLALAFWLQTYFPRKTDFDDLFQEVRESGEALEDVTMQLSIIEKDINGFGERVDRTEKMLMGHSDSIANMNGSLRDHLHSIQTLDSYGGKMVQDMKKELSDIHRKLDLLLSRGCNT
jgi:predicted  nucleic acid-binding Zn-ribbon protein